MSIGSRLKDARLANGLTQESLAKLVGVTKGAIGNYETDVSSPKEPVLFRLMQELNIDANYIYQDYFKPDNARVIPYDEARGVLRNVLTEDEHEALTLYQGAEPTYREVVKDVMRAHQREKKEPVVLTRSIPVFDSPAAAGTPLYAESSYEYMDFPISEIPKGTDFGVRISGESMQPTIKNGSIVFVKKTVELRNGEIGVFMLGDSAVCKRLKLDDQERVVALESDNAEYGSIKGHDLDGFRVVGRVLL